MDTKKVAGIYKKKKKNAGGVPHTDTQEVRSKRFSSPPPPSGNKLNLTWEAEKIPK